MNETEMKLRVHSELMQYLMTRWIGALLGSAGEEQGEHKHHSLRRNRKDECTAIFHHGTQSEMCRKKDSRDEIVHDGVK